MKKFIKLLTVATATTLLFTSLSYADVVSECKGIWLNDERPNEVGTEICKSHYAMVYSDQYRTSLVSGQHLTKSDVDGAETIKRDGKFYSDPIVHSPSSNLYTGTKMDRGHLVPAGSMPTIESEDETFDTSNVAPQARKLNRIKWRELESKVNKMAVTYDDLYVLTSPLFIGVNIQKTNTGLPIPTQFSKVIYIPSTGECKAYVADNNNDADIIEMSVPEFNSKYFHSYFTDVCK